MGKIKKILENELLGGTTSNDVYPVTSTQAVYTSNNEKLSDSYVKSADCEPDENSISLILKSESDVVVDNISILAATTEKAGVMSAEDKVALASLGLTDNTSLNSILLELYVQELSEGKTVAEIKEVDISSSVNTVEGYVNAFRLRFEDNTEQTLFYNIFSTDEEARVASMGVITGFDRKSFVCLNAQKKFGVKRTYKVNKFNRPFTLEFCPNIQNYLQNIEIEGVKGFTDLIVNTHNDVVDLKSYIYGDESFFYTLDDFSTGRYYNTSIVGKVPSTQEISGNYFYKFIDVTYGSKLEVNTVGGANARAWAFLDKNGIVIENAEDGASGHLSVIVPTYATQILVQSVKSNVDGKEIYVKKEGKSGLVKDVDNLQKDVDAIDNSLGKDIPDVTYDKSVFTEGFYASSKQVGNKIGPITALNGWAYLFIDVTDGEIYDINTSGGDNAKAWALLDSNNIILANSETGGLELRRVVVNNPEATRLFVQTNKLDVSYVKKVGQQSIATRLENVEKNIGKVEKQLKILCFGNSFTQDSMSYVPTILKNIAPDVNLTIGMAVIGGCPLIQHLVNFTGASMELDGTTYNVTNYSYQKSVGGGAWSAVNANVDTMIADEDWDIITFQQNGGTAAKDFDIYFAPYIYKLHKQVFNKMNGRNVKIGWILIHGTYANTSEKILEHYLGVVDNAKKVESTTANSIVFPFGTAVQNIRTIETINTLGDTKFLLADGGHLQDGLGCLCAAYCNALKILECIGINNVGVIGEPTRITIEFLDAINTQGRNLGESNTVIGMIEQYVYLAQVAAHKAIQKPYEITDLNACNV